jgi:hypothetical protein
MTDIAGPLMVPMLMQYVHSREKVERIILNRYTQDSTVQCWFSYGLYSSKTSYVAMFYGQTSPHDAKELWKVCAPDKCRMFIWLVLQGRCWTSDRLHRHGLRNHGPFALCSQCVETIDHLLLGCSYN